MGLSLAAIHKMGAKFCASRLVSGVTPMCNAFNSLLDFGVSVNADVLFATATDVIVAPFALRQLLEIMDLDDHYLAVAKGYDPMFGDGASVGIWIWNLRIVETKHRFRDEFKQDMALCERIETATGKSRVYTPRELRMGYHHPVWTPAELYNKIAYSYPKYGMRRKKDIREFVASGLDRNPTNKVMLAGARALERAETAGVPTGSKDLGAMTAPFEKDTRDLHLDGTDYYVHHKEFREYAMAVMRSYKHCIAIDDPAIVQ
jgi:hypothetical protein